MQLFGRSRTKQQETPPIPLAPPGEEQHRQERERERILNSFTGFALRNPQKAGALYGRLSPNAATYEAAQEALRQSIQDDPSTAQRILEQINPTAISSSPTQEDWYWGRLATGDEEDYYWRRLN
jgi:hypothetical protein